MEWNGTHQVSVYAESVNVLGENINIVERKQKLEQVNSKVV